MVISVVDGIGRIAESQVVRAGLAVYVVVGAGHHREVAGFMDQRAGLGIGAVGRCGPIGAAEVDRVWLVWIDVGVSAGFGAAAVEFIRLGAERAAKVGVVVGHRCITAAGDRAEPPGVAAAGVVRIQVIPGIGRDRSGVGAGLGQRGFLGVAAAGEGGGCSRRAVDCAQQVGRGLFGRWRRAAVDRQRDRIGFQRDRRSSSAAGLGGDGIAGFAHQGVGAALVLDHILAGAIHLVVGAKVHFYRTAFVRLERDVILVGRRLAFHQPSHVTHRLAAQVDAEQVAADAVQGSFPVQHMQGGSAGVGDGVEHLA